MNDENNNGFTFQSPSMRQQQLMADSFVDPFAGLPAYRRESLVDALRYSPNPQQEAKRLALANYFGGSDMGKIAPMYANLDQMIEQHFGQPMPVDSAYSEISNMLNQRPAVKDQPFTEGASMPERFGAAAKAGLTELGGSAWKTGRFLFKYGDTPTLIWTLINPDNPLAKFKEDVIKNIGLDSLIDLYDKSAEYERGYARMKPDWFTASKGTGDFLIQSMLAATAEAPRMEVQLAAFAVNPLFGQALVTTTSAAEKHWQLRDDEMDERLKLLNSFATGAINGTLERITGGIIRGAGAGELTREGVKKGVMAWARYTAKNIGKEGSQEFFEQFGENLVDLMTGVDGVEPGRMTLGETMAYLLRGTGESAFIGGLYGGLMSYPGYVNGRQMEQQRHMVRNALLDRRDTLAAKANPEPGEIAELKRINTNLESGDMDTVVDIAYTELVRQAAAEARSQQERDGMTAGELAQAAIQRQDARNRQGHHADDTFEEARQVSKLFPGEQINMVDTFNDLPKNILEEARRRGAEGTEAIYDNASGQIYLIGDAVAPHDVFRTVVHELVVHRGLRQALGDKYTPFMNQVWTDYANEIQSSDWFKHYGLDISMESDRIEAADEFLAFHAESMAEQLRAKAENAATSKWRQFLRKVREWLRGVGFERYANYLDDMELTKLLADSLRPLGYTLKGKRSGSATVETSSGMRFRLDGDVIGALQKIADGSNEETVPDLRSDLEQYGGTNDVTFVYGNAKKGLEHIGARRGIDTVLGVVDTVQNGVITKYVAGKKTIHLEKDGFEAVLSLEEHGNKKTWLLTGWEINKPDAPGQVSTDSGATQGAPTFSRRALGAGLQYNIQQNDGNVNPEAAGSQENADGIRFSVAPPVESEAFKRWFGDSKVVDEDGKPLVVYHGTGSEFYAFDPARSGNGNDQYGSGFYFSTNKDEADGYQGALSDNGKTIAAYLSLQKPIIAKGDNLDEADIDLTLQQSYKIIKKAPGVYDPDSSPIGDFVDIWKAGKVTEGMIREVASNYTGFSLISLESDFFKKNSTAFRQAVYDVTGHDGVIHKYEDGTNHYVAWFPAQIKSATDNVGTFDPNNPDIRFRKSEILGQYSEEEFNDMRDALLPLVQGGKYPTPAEALEHLEKYNFPVKSEGDAAMLAKYANDELKSRKRKAGEKKRWDWILQNNPVLNNLVEKYGEDAKVIPSHRFRGEELSGTWIAKADRNGRYKEGTPSDEVAAALGVSEERLFESLNGLSKKTLFSDYKKNVSDVERYYDRLAREEADRANDEFLDSVLEGSRRMTMDDVKEFPKAARELRNQLKSENDAAAPEWGTVISAYNQDVGDATAYAAGIEDGRRKARDEYRALLNALKEDRKNIGAIQQQARKVVMSLPPEHRGDFIGRIANLAKYSSEPTPKYPDGRRAAELESLVEDIASARQYLEKDHLIERIKKRLQETNIRRVSGKIVGTRTPEAQAELDMIRAIVNNSHDANAARLDALVDRQTELDAAGKEISRDEALEMAYLNHFSDLDTKSPEHLDAALKGINDIARWGRNQLKEQLNEAWAQAERERGDWIHAITGGKKLMTPQQERELAQRRSKGPGRWWESGKKYLRSNMNLEFMLSNLTMNQGEDFRKSKLFEPVRAVHMARQLYEKQLKRRQNAFDAEFDRLFGTGGNIDRAGELSRLRQLQQSSGVYRHQRAPGTGKGLSYERVDAEQARQLLADYDAGQKSLLGYEAAAIRQQLSDLDQKAENKPYTKIGDESSDAVMEAIRRENQETGMIVLPRVKDPGPLAEQPLTQLEALDLWLASQQPDVKMKMRFNGWTDESFEQLGKFLDPKVSELGKWMRTELERDFTALDRVYNELYYTSMPHTADYWPTSYNLLKGASENAAADLANPFKVFGVAPGMLKSRRFHLAEPKAEDAITRWARHIITTEHFKTHAPEVRRLRRVFNSTDMGRAIEQYVGKDAYKDIIESIQIFADGGRRDVERTELSSLYGNWAATNIMINIGSGLKQMFGGFSYALDIPMTDFIKGTAEFWSNPVKNAQILMDTEYFKSRWSGGADRDLKMLMSWAASLGGRKAAWTRTLAEYAGMPTRLGDAFAVLTGGYAVYKYHYDRSIRAGMSETDARGRALTEWEMSTERTQQSGAPHVLNRWQQGGVFARAFTTYLSNPVLQVQAELDTISALIHKRGDSGELAGKLTRQLVVNHLVMPVLMEAVGQFLMHRDNFDEYEFAKFLRAMLIGPFEGLFLTGKVATSLIDTLSTGKYRPASGPIADVVRPANFIRKAFGDDELTADEIYKGVESFAKAGSVLPGVGVGAALLREIRRIWNFVFQDSK